jgi:sRNA-binding regulator protein Hfq
MNPQTNQSIIVFFRNGVRIDGKVLSWSDQKSVIKSSDATTIVIQKTLEDVMFYKITNAKTTYEKLAELPVKSRDDIEDIAALKIELNELEREEIAEKLNTHAADGIRVVNYELPKYIPVKSTIQCPRKETPRKNPGIGSELQDLFSKEDRKH